MMPDKPNFNTLFVILLGGGVFATSALFVSPEISTKYHFVVLLALAGGVWALWRKAREATPVRVGQTLCWTSLFIAFVLIRALCSDNFSARAILPFVCTWLLFFIWYQRPQENLPIAFKRISVVIGAIAVGQALYGLYPLIGYAFHGGSFPLIRGSFDNPAGFAACLAFLSPFCLFNIRFSAPLWRILWIVAGVLVASGVILSRSRSGVLAIGCMATLYFALYIPSLKKILKQYSWLWLLIVVLAGAGLYAIRPDSANGRLLIWRCSSTLVGQHPIAGSGPNGFQGNYMLAQASYFGQNPDDQWAMLADNVLHPFSEWLALVVDYGIIALLLIVLVIYHAIRTVGEHLTDEKKIVLSILSGIALFSCFSYPFRYAFTWVLTAWCLAVLSKEEKTLFDITGKFKTILLSLFAFITLFCIACELKLMKAENAWYRVSESPTYRYGHEDGLLSEYAEIDRTLARHPQFLFSYGAELYREGRFEESVRVLQNCVQVLNDEEVQLLLGMNYIALERWDSAETSLRLASRMCPNRFAPLVGLMRVFIASGRMEDATEMAEVIVTKEIKVASPQVSIFIDEARQLLNND